MERVHRRSIQGAPYNPRAINADARKRLQENLKRLGLMGPAIIVNRPTMMLVGGHRRLDAMDALEGTDDYYIDVTVVDLTDAQEREQNVFLNNAAAQGSFDHDLLHDLLANSEDLDIDAMGFDATELAVVFDDLDFGIDLTPESEAADALADESKRIDDSRKDAKKAKDAMAGARADVKRVAKERDQAEHYVVFVFRTDDEATAAMELAGFDPSTRYVDGAKLLKLLG